MDDELKQLLEEMRQQNDAAQAETRRHFERLDASHIEMLRRFERLDASHVETRRHFDTTIKRLDKKFDTLAEAVKHVDEKLDREVKTLREEMHDGFAETHALIRFSHAELDRRLRALE